MELASLLSLKATESLWMCGCANVVQNSPGSAGSCQFFLEWQNEPKLVYFFFNKIAQFFFLSVLKCKSNVKTKYPQILINLEYPNSIGR